MNTKVKKAVIPAAGLGTRFFPTTKCLAKELIPLVNKPSIQHVIEEGIAGGIEEFILVVSPEKENIKQYFSCNESLNEILKSRNQIAALEKIQKIETMAKFSFVIQKDPLGLGHAVLQAKKYIQNEPFLVILPDDIIDAENSTSLDMINIYNERTEPVLAVMEVDWAETERYGIVNATPLNSNLGIVKNIVEKPKRNEAPSNLAVIGRYILPYEIFEILETTTPGAGSEIQLTDAIKKYMEKNSMLCFSFPGTRYDTGTPLGWLKANLGLGIKDPELGEDLQQYVKLLASTL